MPRRSRIYNVSFEELQDLYSSNSAGEIADVFDVSESAVRRRLKSLGIRKPVAREYTPEEEEESIKQVMVDAFDKWGRNNWRGYNADILLAIKQANISYEGNGEWQINSLDTDRVATRLGHAPRLREVPGSARIQKGDIKLMYNDLEGKMEIRVKEYVNRGWRYTTVI